MEVDRTSLARTAFAGSIGTAAVHLAMRAARTANITRIHFPHALGSAVLKPERPARTLGWTLFFANGIALAMAYRLLLSGKTARPVAGAALGLVHGLIAATGARVGWTLHPRPRRAGLFRRRPSASDLAVLCGVHVIYGALVGTFTDIRHGSSSPLARRPRP